MRRYSISGRRRFSIELARHALDGRLWAQDVGAPDDSTASWRLRDVGGRCPGAVPMPRALAVHEVGSDYVLGVVRDRNGGEQGCLHALQRGA